MVGLSSGEKLFIEGGIAQDLRNDGRKRLTYRPIFVKTGEIAQANGSARVKIGSTEVIVTVTEKLGKPTASAPNKGNVSIDVEFSPTAGPEFEGRGGEELSGELSAALRVCLLGSKTGARAGIDLSSLSISCISGDGIDFSSLSIVDGKICWDLCIDGLVISMGGNVLDAFGAAIKAALSVTLIPKVHVSSATPYGEEPQVDVSEEYLQFDATAVPVIVTLTKVGQHYIVDATSEEESQMSTALSVSFNPQGFVCGLVKRGSAGLHVGVIIDMISKAQPLSVELMNEVDSQIAASYAMEE